MWGLQAQINELRAENKRLLTLVKPWRKFDMRVAQEQVECFHEKMGYPIGETPVMPDWEMRQQRYKFMREELEEYMRAAENGDLVEVADALADLAYVLFGTAIVCGIDLQPIFAEVHRSNMTKDKLDPVTKKGGKGPGFEKPRIAELLLVQTNPEGYGHGV
jgi:predicted HAD superfamily Cof-like phosphohydrolase